MAFTNILSIPGLTYALRYRQIGGSGETTPTNPVTVSGGQFQVPIGTADWSAVNVEVTDYAGAILPLDARITLTGISTASPYGCGAAISSVLFNAPFNYGGPSPNNDVVSGVGSASSRFYGVGVGELNSWLDGGSFLIELDVDFVVPGFWTEHAGTAEFDDRELRKLDQRIVVEEVPGQPFVPASTTCTPRPTVPGPPGSGCQGICGTGPGSGSEPEPDPPSGQRPPGSGQPPTYPVCWTTTATSGGVTRRFRCCRNGPSDPGRCEPI